MAVAVRMNRSGLLNYAQSGKEALRAVRKAMYRVMNAGRRVARQKIRGEFQTRTGFLRRQAGKMRPKVGVRSYEIKGEVKPIPRLMNIFEGGATLAHGRGFLRPRPVVGPGQQAINKTAQDELGKVMAGIGR